MSNGDIIVWTDFLYDDNNYSRSVIVGRKFLCLQPAFVKPYLSSDYGIYLGSNLSEFIEKWPITSVTAKIQVFPRRPQGKPNLGDENQEWYLMPLRHTIKKNIIYFLCVFKHV